MNLREEARKLGGEELVQLMDNSSAVEDRIFEKMMDLMHEEVKGKTGREEQVIMAGLCEATSRVFAAAVVTYANASAKTSRPEAIVLAIQSVSTNISDTFENLDTAKSGVANDIVAAAKKVGDLPKGEDGK